MAASFSLVIADIRLPDGAEIADLVGAVPLVVLGDAPVPIRERVAEGGGTVVAAPDMLTFRGRLVGSLH